MIYVSELLTSQTLELLNERQRMAVKGLHGSFEFVTLLGTFQRLKSEAEVDRRIDRQFGLLRLR
jgi:pantothenate kinase